MHPDPSREDPIKATPEGLDGDYEGRVGRIARGVGVGSFGNGIGRLLGFAIQLVLARVLGASLLGAYILGTTIVSLANILSQLGMDNGVVRYVSHHRAAGDDAQVKGVILQAILITFALSVLLATAMFFGAGLLAGVFAQPSLEPFLETLLKGFALAVPFLTVMSMALWATQGFQTVKYSTYVQQVVQPLAALGLIYVFYLLGVPVFGAVAAYVLSMIFGSALALRYLWKVFPQIADRQVPAVFETEALFRASGPMIVASFMRHLNTWTSTLVLGLFVTTGAVAIYNSAARTALLASVFIIAFNGIFSPMISDLYQRSLMRDLDTLYKDVSRWVFTCNLVFFFGAVLLARDVLSVFGPRFAEEGWPVLIIVAGAQMFSASVGSTGRVLAMTDRQSYVMYATLGSVVLNVALNLLLVPAFGIIGSAVATAVAMAVVNALTLAAVKRFLGLWPYTPRYLKPIAAGLLAVAVAYAFRYVFPLPVSFLAVPVVGGVYTAAFLAGLLALGLEPSDRQFLKAGWSAVRFKLNMK